MTTPFPTPRSLPTGDDSVSSSAAMRYLGWALIFLTIAPPVAVILWRLATMPWG